MMKWVLYAVSAAAILVGIIVMLGAVGVFQETAGAILMLIGTSSFGFAVVAGKLDTLTRRLRED